MASFTKELPAMSTLLSAYASISTLSMLIRTVIKEMIPKKFQDFISTKLTEIFFSRFSSDFTFIIEDRWQAVSNETFRAVELYLPTIVGQSTKRLLIGNDDSNKITSPPKTSVPVDAKVTDTFQGADLEWTLHEKETKKYYCRQKQYFELKCKKKDRELVMKDYLPYISERAEKILKTRENLNIYTYEHEDSRWESAVFKHPATFETLAIDPEMKESIKKDLDVFGQRKRYFQSVGRAWKRGYLLYGPPGTGKSTLVAAIANYLRFHIYDLQLQGVKNDSALRRILTATTNRSILLIEDIDCSTKSTKSRARVRNGNRKDDDDDEDDSENEKMDSKLSFDPGVSLSGLLNFIDGLWSSCGDERIIIFTTNYKDKLDPALLRPGRMDVHIYMGHCTPAAFKTLARTYLGIEEHALFKCIEDMIQKIQVTPAEVAQQLMRNDKPQVVLESLIEFLNMKVNHMEKNGSTKDEEEVIKKEIFKCGKLEVDHQDANYDTTKLEVDHQDANYDTITVRSVYLT